MSAAAAAPSRPNDIALLKNFAKLEDPRQSAKVLYPLEEIVLLVVCATIADWTSPTLVESTLFVHLSCSELQGDRVNL